MKFWREFRLSDLRFKLLKCVLVSLLAGSLPGARADDAEAGGAGESTPLPWERGFVKLGGLVSVLDSTLTFGLQSGSGVKINGEDELGLDSKLTVIRAEGMFRPGDSRRQQLDVSYAGFHRDGDTTLSGGMTIDNITYPAGADVRTVFNFDLIRASYSYALVQTERMRLAVGAGAYVVPVKYGVDIQTTTGRSALEGGDATLPLPELALRAEFQLLPKLFLNASIDGIYFNVSDLKVGLLDTTVALEYRPWRYFGLGFGYSGTLAEVESESTHSHYPGGNSVGNVHVRYSGLSLYGKFTF